MNLPVPGGHSVDQHRLPGRDFHMIILQADSHHGPSEGKKQIPLFG
jgi:hypothetical protein